MTSTLSGSEKLPEKISSAVIFLHGLGSNGDDLMGLAPYFANELSNTAFLSPNAPYAVPMTYNGYQWFDLWDRSPLQIEQGVRATAPLIVDYINNTAKRFKIPTSKIMLVGFSQGTMMSLHTGLRLIDGLAGIVGFSGAMISPETLADEKLSKLPPVLLVHGLVDPIVPAMASFYAESTIRENGGDVRYVQRPFLIHSIDDTGIQEAVAFTKNRLKS
jgi:phospholipase/carboxylesterase